MDARSSDHSSSSEAAPVPIPAFLDRNATFPEKLMYLLAYTAMECDRLDKDADMACIGWVLNGQAFVIRDPTELVNRILPLVAFHKVKFSSFTRKLYRWGFRQTTTTTTSPTDLMSHHGGSRGEGGDDDDDDDKPKNKLIAGKKVFAHPYFQRDDTSRMKLMKSVTANNSNNNTSREAIASLNARQEEAVKRLAHIIVPTTTTMVSNVSMALPARQPKRLIHLSHSGNTHPTVDNREHHNVFPNPFYQSLRDALLQTTRPRLEASPLLLGFAQQRRDNIISEYQGSNIISDDGVSDLLRAAMTSMIWQASIIPAVEDHNNDDGNVFHQHPATTTTTTSRHRYC